MPAEKLPDKKRDARSEGVMTVTAHLAELRRRLIWSFVGIALATVGGWFLYEFALAHITAPMKDVAGANLNFQTIGAAFDLK
ncbi:preprotein translocase subunit TatC, partial [Mobiluncus curtisii]